VFLIVVLVTAVSVPLVAPAVPAAGAIGPDRAAAAPISLADTKWVLSALDGNLPLPGAMVTLQLNKDGSATGSDGCNRFRTTYAQKGATLTFRQPAASTMIMCPEPVMKQATAFMAALAATTNFLANKKILVLLAGDQILATFVADAQSLAGTSWEVVNFNNGRQAVVGLLADTEISANFGESEITGDAGCNQYFAGYSVNGDAIEIGTPARTFRFCPEPEGVMDQETEFLTALESAATYSIEGDMLQMRTAEDALAVVMKRKAIIDLPEPKPAPKTPKGRVVGAQTLNVRSGPSTAFPVIAAARAGDEAEIAGRSADGRWWAVSAPSLPGGIGWVSADFVLATNAENVPVIQSPPPPTPRPPTPTPVPTARPTALPPPPPTPSPEISFWADRTSITQGECATINWSVQNVQAVWVYPLGEPYHRFPRTGQGSERVCPSTTTTYEMRVLLRNGTTVFRQIPINVLQPIAPPQPPPVAPPPAVDPLAGTRWTVTNFNNGRGAVVGLIAGTTISLDFDTAGRVSGRSGCNTYSAGYRASGNSLSVDRPSATSMICDKPEGVMLQEQQYLEALHSAATFQISGDQLQIRSGADELAVFATRAP
jgi:heat shock protein HslJ